MAKLFSSHIFAIENSSSIIIYQIISWQHAHDLKMSDYTISSIISIAISSDQVYWSRHAAVARAHAEALTL